MGVAARLDGMETEDQRLTVHTGAAKLQTTRGAARQLLAASICICFGSLT